MLSPLRSTFRSLPSGKGYPELSGRRVRNTRSGIKVFHIAVGPWRAERLRQHDRFHGQVEIVPREDRPKFQRATPRRSRSREKCRASDRASACRTPSISPRGRDVTTSMGWAAGLAAHYNSRNWTVTVQRQRRQRLERLGVARMAHEPGGNGGGRVALGAGDNGGGIDACGGSKKPVLITHSNARP